ncbi:MAG: hypothetical protein E6J91_04335 [Deltaproteobacteria bacterium]|nr:MAG: hypothetical protein E6J91_04335 [Deltaproteobacteria bacterium]
MRPTGDHFYTADIAERDNAVNQFGYVNEGIACWALPIAPASTQTALFRMFLPHTGDHFYTTSAPERDNAVLHLGYQDEGVACDVLAAAAAPRRPPSATTRSSTSVT